MEIHKRASPQIRIKAIWSETRGNGRCAHETLQLVLLDMSFWRMISGCRCARWAMSYQVHKLCSHALCDNAWLREIRVTAGVRFEEPKTFLGVVCRVEPAFEECHSANTVPSVCSVENQCAETGTRGDGMAWTTKTSLAGALYIPAPTNWLFDTVVIVISCSVLESCLVGCAHRRK